MLTIEQNHDQTEKNCHLLELKNLPRVINCSNKIKIDVSKTEYPIIRTVATTCLNWKLWTKQAQRDDINVFWVDTYINQETLKKLRPYQKINHFPGSYQLGRKNNLAINLSKMRKRAPEQYSFFPQTWILP